jgi:hypothetical protein
MFKVRWSLSRRVVEEWQDSIDLADRLLKSLAMNALHIGKTQSSLLLEFPNGSVHALLLCDWCHTLDSSTLKITRPSRVFSSSPMLSFFAVIAMYNRGRRQLSPTIQQMSAQVAGEAITFRA